MFIFTVGVNHRTAPVELRERLSFTGQSTRDALAALKSNPSIEGCVILFTCNRTEIYAATGELNEGLSAVQDYLFRKSGVNALQLKNHVYVHTLHDAVRHLFRVVAGLDSMLLGETQILGQVRDAYRLALERACTNNALNALFQQSIAVSRRVRRETGIDQNAVSVSYAAVELARQTLGELAGKSVLIIGAGKISKLAVQYLMASGVSGIIVSNRSYPMAVEIAGEYGGQAVKFDELYDHMLNSDIVFSCTSAFHYVVHYQQVAKIMNRRRGAQLMMIDIAVPRDIDPLVASLPGIVLYDIDDLHGVVDQNLARRSQAAIEAEGIIDEELKKFMQWLDAQFVISVVAALKQRAEEIKQNEFSRALNRLGEVSPHDRKVIGSLANSIVNQLLHVPITRLKDYALTSKGHLYTEALQNLFDLKTEDEERV